MLTLFMYKAQTYLWYRKRHRVYLCTKISWKDALGKKKYKKPPKGGR